MHRPNLPLVFIAAVATTLPCFFDCKLNFPVQCVWIFWFLPTAFYFTIVTHSNGRVMRFFVNGASQTLDYLSFPIVLCTLCIVVLRSKSDN